MVAAACNYVIPWAPIKAVESGEYACVCLSGIYHHLGEHYMKSFSCLLDYQDVRTMYDAYKTYCHDDCGDDDIETMLDIIEAESPVCDYFVNDREVKALQERVPLKCECALSLGDTYDEAAE